LGPTGLGPLARALERHPILSSLKELYLSDNNLGPTGLDALARALERQPAALSSLQTLNLFSNNLGDGGLDALKEANKKVLRRTSKRDFSYVALVSS